MMNWPQPSLPKREGYTPELLSPKGSWNRWKSVNVKVSRNARTILHRHEGEARA